MLWYLTIISKIPLLFKVNHKDNSHTLDYIDLKRDLDEEFLYKKKLPLIYACLEMIIMNDLFNSINTRYVFQILYI